MGGWKTPFPVRLGGGAHLLVENAYDALRANLGDALSDEEDSASDAETQAQARLIAHADSRLEQYVAEADPRALTSLLKRWEAILGIQPSRNDSGALRRARVAARLMSTHTASTVGIDRIAREAFYPWTASVQYIDADDAVMYWPGGNSHPDFDWYSTVAHIIVEYVRPAYAGDDATEQRVAACINTLDEYAPAWATFDVSETQSTGTHALEMGFFLDQPNIDVSVLW